MSYCLNPNCDRPVNPDRTKFCQNCGSRLSLGNRYQAFQPVGQGTSSRTFLGVDTHKLADTRCVIKVFANRDEDGFRQEVARLSELSQHPQIPDVYAYFERHQQQYLIQEFVDGRSLLQEMTEDGAFNESQICQVLQDVLPLLKFLHDRHIIHRDIKPDNLVRCHDQRLMLVDLGAIKQVTPVAIGKTGTLIGSAEYTAPEQLMGQAEFASDLYSLGVTCIHLLTGIRPFDLYNSADGSWLWRSVAGIVSDRFAHMIDTLLQHSVSDRYPSADAVLQDLTDLLPSASSVVRTSTVSPGSTPKRKSPFQVWTCLTTWQSSSDISSIAITPDETRLFVGSSTGAIEVWDGQRQSPCSVINGHEQAIVSLALSPDYELLASSSWDYTIKLWQVSTETLLATLKGHTNVVTAVAISPDGRILASGSRDKTIRLWDLQANGRLICTLQTPAAIEALAVPPSQTASNPDSAILASGCSNGVVQMWHLGTRELLRSLPAHAASVNALAIAADLQTVVSGSWDMTVKLRNLHTGGVYHRLTGHSLPVAAVALSPTGQILATGSHDNTIKLWDVEMGAPIATLTDHSAAISAIAFTSSGRLLSASRDGVIKWWEPSLE